MMKKFTIILVALFLGLSPKTKADEGMWLPLFIDRLNYVDLEKMGLHLTADEIYSINHSSLKDAIIIFGGGCTGEIVSPEGLIFTNHHCGYGAIQSHSTIEHDYLTDGFWALNKNEELPNEGLSVRFLVRIEDVTEKILASLDSSMDEAKRSEKIRETGSAITKEATKDTEYEASVRGFFGGNEFYLFVYEVFNDVRLVGAPPSSIGKFGADTDNWMWPRHTGDFSIFRVYTAPNGKPAKHSKDNIPMKSKYYLPISIDGVEREDFAMILGYPGSTDRYLSSWGAQLAIDESNPTIVKIRDRKLEIMREFMDNDDAVRIQYASKYARVSNYWKYFIGQTKGLKRLKVVEEKQKQETAFLDWVNLHPDRKTQYGEALQLLENGVIEKKQYNLASIYLNEAILRGSEILSFARNYSNLQKLLESKEDNQTAINDEINKLRNAAPKFFKDYYLPLDQKMLGCMLEMYYQNIPKKQQPTYLDEINKKYKSNFEAYANEVFENSIFVSAEKVNSFLNKPSAKILAKDPAVQLLNAFLEIVPPIRTGIEEAGKKTEKGTRLFIAGLREMSPDKQFYPDANSTMRFTYGQVLDYYPSDAVHYDFRTHLSGVMEKEDPANWEFVVPEKLKTLNQNKDFGRYGQDGEMVVCFLTNNDITGGNSGSPVINGWGELIGLAFDGNWEAMSGDIAFEPALQRTIVVDIRYVLFIIEKYAEAKNLIDELTISKGHPKIKATFEKIDIPETID